MSNVMATQQAGGAGGLGGLVEQLFGSLPIAGLLQGVAKVGESLFSGDFLSMAQGGEQFFGALFKQLPAFQTEYVVAGQVGSNGSGWAAAISGSVSAGAPSQHAPGAASEAASSAKAGVDASVAVMRGERTADSAGARSSSLAAELAAYERALQTFDQHYTTFSSRLDRDAFISLAELRALADGKNTSPELREAARFMLDHPEYHARLLAAVPPLFGWEKDDRFGKLELFNELEMVRRERQALGASRPRGPRADCPTDPRVPIPQVPTPSPTPPTTGTPPTDESPSCEAPSDPPLTCEAPSTRSNGISDILGDARLSVEEKLKRVMMLLTNQIDDELIDVMAEMDGATAKRADVTAKGASATADDKAALKRQETDQQFLQLRLQELIERRKAMFELMSNLSASFHAMSRVAISNLGRA